MSKKKKIRDIRGRGVRYGKTGEVGLGSAVGPYRRLENCQERKTLAGSEEERFLAEGHRPGRLEFFRERTVRGTSLREKKKAFRTATIRQGLQAEPRFKKKQDRARLGKGARAIQT